jgi:hypothetical protein
VIHSSETLVHIRTTRRYILEDGAFHNFSCEDLKSYIFKEFYNMYSSRNIRMVNVNKG